MRMKLPSSFMAYSATEVLVKMLVTNFWLPLFLISTELLPSFGTKLRTAELMLVFNV